MPSAIAVALLAAATATDFGAGSSAWNGLGQLGAIAAQAGCPLVAAERLAWDALDGHDVLLVVHPRRPLDGDKLARFLRAGGRAIVADDVDAAARATLAPLGLAPGPAAATLTVESHEGNGALPIARPLAQPGPLAQALVAADHLVTNHPGTLRTDGLAPSLEVVYALAPDAAVVVAGRVGRGRLVALADASLLINNMLELDEDRAFAAGLVAATCRAAGRGDRLLLVTGDVDERGAPPAALRDAPDAEGGTLRERVDGALASLSLDGGGGEGAARRELLRVAGGLALVGLTLLLLARALPSRVPDLDDGWTRAPSPPPLGYAALVERCARGDLPGGQTLLAAVLREEVVARLGEALARAGGAGSPPVASLGGLDAATLARVVGARLGPEVARAARRCWGPLGGATGGRRAPSMRRLARMHRRAVALLALLDERTPSVERRLDGP